MTPTEFGYPLPEAPHEPLQYRQVLSANSFIGNRVVNRHGEDLGMITAIMIDTITGQVAYATLSVGGFLGVGDKLFAVPWRAMRLDQENKTFLLNVDKEIL